MPRSHLEMAEEQRLVERVRHGDHAAFRKLVERYEDLVAATVIGMLGPGAEAEDTAQVTFVRLFEAIGQYEGRGGVAPYITRIAMNLSLNTLARRRRRRWRFLSRDEHHGLPEPAASDDFGRDLDQGELIRRALDRLTPDHRAVIVLRIIDGYSTNETAELLGVPIGTVLSRLSRAQQKLKDILRPHLQDL